MRYFCSCGGQARDKFFLSKIGSLTWSGEVAKFLPGEEGEWEGFDDAPEFQVLPWWCGKCKTLYIVVVPNESFNIENIKVALGESPWHIHGME